MVMDLIGNLFLLVLLWKAINTNTKEINAILNNKVSKKEQNKFKFRTYLWQGLQAKYQRKALEI